MKSIYLDNAATTPLRQEVIDEMLVVMQNEFGNPSSTHSIGRSAKAIIETSRKSIAKLLNCTAQEIIFTANATEGTNWILNSCVNDLGINRIITSKIEHHATLYTILSLQKKYNIEVVFIPVLQNGTLDYGFLENNISSSQKTLVSVMHVNNETGVVNNIEKIASICKANDVLFHCDTVQSIGKKVFDLQELSIDFLVASAHKFHGPKGIGFAFIRKNNLLQPLIVGGEQEKGMRAGTESVHQIAGMTKAFELSYKYLSEEEEYISTLKDYCWEKINEIYPLAKINGDNVFYNILNVLFPFSEEKTAMILFTLDLKGIAVSRGSACQSGSQKPSHVLSEMLCEEDLKKPSLRISFSHYNTKEDIDNLVKCLTEV